MNNLLSGLQLSGPAPSSTGPQLLWAPLWHRWGTGAGQDTHPCSQAVLQKPGRPQWEIQGACGVCHQRWELYEADQSWASVTSAGGGGKAEHFLNHCVYSLLALCYFLFFSVPPYLRCLRTRWCCPTVLCECSPSSTKCAYWSRDRVLLRRWLTSILSEISDSCTPSARWPF